MPGMLVPSPRFRSVTAATGLADAHDNHIYSAACLQSGATSSVDLFSVGKGGAMLNLRGSTITATTNAHQTTYSLLTTNFDRPSQMGDTLGDGAFRGLGIIIESAYNTISGGSAGAPNTYGATFQEASEIVNKCSGELKIGTKSQISGALNMFPTLGGLAGSVSNTGNASVAAVVQNGGMPSGRRFRTPIMVGRTDTIAFTLAVANGSSLTFSVATGVGQPTLVWCVILADMASDVR